MSKTTTGKIYFTENLSDSRLDNLSFFIVEKATKNRIGIRLGANVSEYVLNMYKNEIYPKEGRKHLVFQLTESPRFPHSEKFYTPVYLDSNTKKYLGFKLEESRLPEVQQFFETINDAYKKTNFSTPDIKINIVK